MRIDRFSWSKYSTAELCGQLYYFREVEKRRSEPSASMLRGRGLHKSAEANYTAQIKTGRGLELEHVREIADRTCRLTVRNEGLRRDFAYEDVSLKKLPDLLANESVALATEYHTEIASQIVPLATELKIEIPPSQIWRFVMVGVIDMIDDRAVIHDTKTKRKAPASNLADNSGQLSNYEILYRARVGRPSGGQKQDYVWRTPKTNITKSVTQSTQRDTHQLARFAVDVQRMHKALEAEIYIPAKADSWICQKKWCEYTGICPVFNAGKRVTT